MNPQDKTKVGHPARVDVKSIDQIAMEFETAWRESLEGGPRPDVASFLKSHADIDQESLREQLEKINLEFQQRTTGHQSEALAPTLAIGVQASERDDSKTVEPTPTEAIEPGQEPRLDPTILLAPGVSPGLDATMDLGPQAAAEQEPTIQFGESQIGKAGGDSEEDGFRLQATMDLDGVQPDRDALDPTFPLGEAASFELGPRERKGEQVPRVRGYKILGVLGRGGMGVVYRALHVKLKRVVALKMVLAGSHAGPEQLDRFYSEAEAVAHLQHPNIIQIYEVAEQDGLPYFSLEYVDGGSLVQKCAGKPLADQEAARLVELLARAMHYAHRHDVVHRDLKPANILLTADGVPKVTDFGLAKRLEEGSPSQTRSGAILGTPSYMAPEQALGEVHEIGPLTDVYSLGAILYELITGRPPFLAPNAMDTVMQVAQQDPVAPTQLQPQVSRDLETICLKCLQKEKGRRYASAEDLAEDLRRFQAGEPITARAVSGPERLCVGAGETPKSRD